MAHNVEYHITPTVASTKEVFIEESLSFSISGIMDKDARGGRGMELSHLVTVLLIGIYFSRHYAYSLLVLYVCYARSFSLVVKHVTSTTSSIKLSMRPYRYSLDAARQSFESVRDHLSERNFYFLQVYMALVETTF